MTVVTVDMDTERTRARHRDKRDKTQDVFAEESEALDQIAKQVFSNTNTLLLSRCTLYKFQMLKEFGLRSSINLAGHPLSSIYASMNN